MHVSFSMVESVIADQLNALLVMVVSGNCLQAYPNMWCAIHVYAWVTHTLHVGKTQM
jgi:hypothetical protein